MFVQVNKRLAWFGTLFKSLITIYANIFIYLCLPFASLYLCYKFVAVHFVCVCVSAPAIAYKLYWLENHCHTDANMHTCEKYHCLSVQSHYDHFLLTDLHRWIKLFLLSMPSWVQDVQFSCQWDRADLQWWKESWLTIMDRDRADLQQWTKTQPIYNNGMRQSWFRIMPLPISML